MSDLIVANRVPSNIDYAAPSQFRFQISRIPEVEYFIVGVNLPQISLSGDAGVNTPYKEFFNGGDTVEYDDLSVRFMVNENLENWLEVYEWIEGIGFPKQRGQFEAMVQKSEKYPQDMFSDATLTILTNKNNPILQFKFSNVYPTSLTGLEYDTQQADVQLLSATAVFKFMNIEVNRL